MLHVFLAVQLLLVMLFVPEPKVSAIIVDATKVSDFHTCKVGAAAVK